MSVRRTEARVEPTTESSAPRHDAQDATHAMTPTTRRLLGLGLAIAMVAPPLIAIVVMAGRTWHPVDDFAIIDLRVRDVWSAHPSLTGLFSRRDISAASRDKVVGDAHASQAAAALGLRE